MLAGYGGKFKNSILWNTGEAFSSAAAEFGVDVSLLIAIAMTESARGTSSQASKYNNIAGLMGSNGLMRFASVGDSIRSLAKTVSTLYKKGYKSASQIAYSGNYCARSAASQWLSNVNSYLKRISKYFDTVYIVDTAKASFVLYLI